MLAPDRDARSDDRPVVDRDAAPRFEGFVGDVEGDGSTEAGAPFGTIESVKAVSDLFAPLSGEVLEINEALEDQPELVNEACYGDGWLIKLRPTDPEELEGLLDADAYKSSVSDREQ